MTASECENPEDNNNTKRTSDDPEPPMPLDGGWGWMVVISSLLCNIIVDGVCFSFGIFYVEFLEYFGESKAKTAWVGSLIPGMYLGVGPIVSALANKFGCRTVTIIGSVMAAISFFASTFSPNINWLIVTYGICGGFSFGLMYLPSIVIVGYYFEKKRAFATGLAVCGSGIGTFLFAPLGTILLKNYGWQGAYWIISGIILHGVACGLIFRPLEQNRPPRRRHESDPKEPIKPGHIMNKIQEHKNRVRMESHGSLNGMLITTDNELITDKEKVEKIMAHYDEQGGYNPPTGSTPDLVRSVSEEPNDNLDRSQSHLNVSEIQSTNAKPVHKQLARLISTDSRGGMRHRTTSNSYDQERLVAGSELSASRESISRSRRELARPLYRADIFYSGSVQNLREYTHSTDMHSYVASVTSVPNLPYDEDPDSCKARCLPLVSVLTTMLDFSLLKSPTFLLLCVASVLAMTGFFTPFVYITAYTIEQGVSIQKAALLLSVLGLFNTIGRIISGWLSDRTWADCILIHNLALVVAGLATCVLPFLKLYPVIVVYCSIFGSCIAAFIALRSIVLVELLGVQKLSNSFGILLLFQGIASIIGSPLCGALYDWSGSYSISFFTSGGLIALAGFICLPVRCLARWEKRRAQGDTPDVIDDDRRSRAGSQYSRLSTREVLNNSTLVTTRDNVTNNPLSSKDVINNSIV